MGAVHGLARQLLIYGDERRGDCLDRLHRAVAELRKKSTFGLDARTADIELCNRCKAKQALAGAVEPLLVMDTTGWISEWPEWRNKK